ncbi:FecCD family ABC transporter permease [Cyclobacterium marinum]|uniref:ABC-type transporter, integral membrane subunit n=1 Tax=Cyclobacterium marinum (strain ATCC 25205 / DSM 745 / LMG 13164 / NCIMB 1802) TaxID=880070 RepID=G0J4Y6_CYCMS|nr:iron ABC transporter permease [Cyclobacterium marinum]AEL25980.1 ABC-type transporter, integral membrane subunit [Cyclobacterium marinum DSM 745]
MIVSGLVKSKKHLNYWVLLSLTVILCFVLLISLTKGAYSLDLSEVIAIISNSIGFDLSRFESRSAGVLLQIRLPRILLGVLVGGGLGIAGAALQGLFRNPLVEPGLIGVSSGSALFAVIFLVLLPGIVGTVPLLADFGLPMFAFFGGLLHVLAVYYLGTGNGGGNTATIILAGVAINAMAGALIGLTLFYADDAALRSFTFWSLGDLSGASWQKLPIAAIFICIPSLLLMRGAKNLNAMALGEKEAFYMGVNVKQTKVILLVATALIVGVAVSLSGMIGFVGLIVPHLMRICFGADHRLVLPGSFLLGAILLNFSDLLARTIAIPAEMPIGVITSLLGAPFFMGLIYNLKK